MTPEVRRDDLLYYDSVTDAVNGPAMTWSMAAIGFVELRDAASAASNFNRSFANAQPPFDVWTETPTGGTPNFVTGAGGFLQALVYGYPYLRLGDTAVTINASMLIEGSTSLRLRGLSYLGNRLLYSYNATHLTLSLQPASTSPAVTRGVYERTREYADVCAAAGNEHGCAAVRDALRDLAAKPRPARLGGALAAPGTLADRSQAGKVMIHVRGRLTQVAATPLVVVDESGARYPLTNTTQLVLPLQLVSLEAA